MEWLAAPLRPAASSRSSGSRCSTRSSTGATTICRRPTSGRARSRMSKTRDKSGARDHGLARGRLPDADRRARADRIRELGGEIHTGDGSVDRDRRGGAARAAVSSSRVATGRSTSCSAPSLRRRPPRAFPRARGARPRRPLPLPRRRLPPRCGRARSVSPYYHLNITDRRVPLTTVVETTHVVDPEYVGGHLLYVTQYVDPATPTRSGRVDELERDVPGARPAAIFPELATTRSSHRTLQRARVTEPVHLVGGASEPAGDVPGARPRPGVDARTSTPRSSAARRCIGVAEPVVPGILERASSRPAERGCCVSRARPSRSAHGPHALRVARLHADALALGGPRRVLARAARADLGHLGRPRQRHGLRRRRRDRGSRTARCPTSTSRTTTARSPRARGARRAGRRLGFGSAGRTRTDRRHGAILAGTYVLARKLVEPARRLPGDRADGGRRVHPEQLLLRPPAHARGDARHAGAARAAARAGAMRYARRGRGWLLAVGAVDRAHRPDEARDVARGGRRRRAWLVLAAFARRAAPARRGPVARRPPPCDPGRRLRPVRRRRRRGDLLFENLYPVDILDAAATRCCENRMPMTVSSFAELGGRLALYVAGVAAPCWSSRGSSRAAGAAAWRASPAWRSAACCSSPALVVKPEALRDGLQYVYGWIPAARRSRSPSRIAAAGAPRRALERASAAELATAAVLAVLAFTTYNVVLRPRLAAADGRLLRAVRRRAAGAPAPRGARARPPGRTWSAWSGCSSSSAPARGSRCQRRQRRVGNGARARRLDRGRRRRGGAAFQGALDAIAASTRAGRADPGRAVADRPLRARGAEEPAAASLAASRARTPRRGRAARHRGFERAGVRFGDHVNRAWSGYGHTTFGDSFDRELAGWIDGNFTTRRTLRAARATGPRRPRRLAEEEQT